MIFQVLIADLINFFPTEISMSFVQPVGGHDGLLQRRLVVQPEKTRPKGSSSILWRFGEPLEDLHERLPTSIVKSTKT